MGWMCVEMNALATDEGKAWTMNTRPTTDPPVVDLAGVIWRLGTAADDALDKAMTTDGDPLGGYLGLGAQLIASQGLALLGEHAYLCNEPASTSSDAATLIREAEQVLASRPIEQWPPGTSGMIVDVCDLMREHCL